MLNNRNPRFPRKRSSFHDGEKGCPLFLKGVSERPKSDWQGDFPLNALAVAALWTLPLVLGQQKDEERSLAEITGLKFLMDRKGDDERK